MLGKVALKSFLFLPIVFLLSCSENTGHRITHVPPGVDGVVVGDFSIIYDISVHRTRKSLGRRVSDVTLHYELDGRGISEMPVYTKMKDEKWLVAEFLFNQNEHFWAGKEQLEIEYYLTYRFDGELGLIGRRVKLIWQRAKY